MLQATNVLSLRHELLNRGRVRLSQIRTNYEDWRTPAQDHGGDKLEASCLLKIVGSNRKLGFTSTAQLRSGY